MREREVEPAETRAWTAQDVYQEFQPRIRRFLSRLLRTHDVEDLTQEVFIKISEALPGFRGECALSTWVFRIARNVGIDSWRGLSSRRGREARLDAHDPAIEPGPDAEQRLARREMAHCVRQYVDALPQGYRSVIVLREDEGLTNSEIAAALGISVDTVKIRLHRARCELRRVLGEGCTFYRDQRNELACQPSADVGRT